MGTGSDYIRKEDVEELFDKFWNALREDLLPGGAGVSRVDVGNCLINQLVQSLGQVAKDHGVRWTQELFDVSLIASPYTGSTSCPQRSRLELADFASGQVQIQSTSPGIQA